MLVVCERWVGDGDRLPHIDPSSTSFLSWLGLLNRGSLRAQSPLSAVGSHFGFLSPNDSNSNWLKLSVSWFYFCFTFTCFCGSSLHRCISWLTARLMVNMIHKLMKEKWYTNVPLILLDKTPLVLYSELFFLQNQLPPTKVWESNLP